MTTYFSCTPVNVPINSQKKRKKDRGPHVGAAVKTYGHMQERNEENGGQTRHGPAEHTDLQLKKGLEKKNV